MTFRFRTRKRNIWLSLILLLVSLGIVYAQNQGLLHSTTTFVAESQPGTYRISRFVDGDTIAVDMNGHTEKIRFIGVDTPETHKPNAPVQCYGPEAAAYTKKLIGNQRVRLVADSLSTNRDRYDRLLRYVYLPDGTNLNENLIQNGYGFYYPYFPFTKSATFDHAEQSAIAGKKGVWAHCKPTPTDQGGYISNNV